MHWLTKVNGRPNQRYLAFLSVLPLLLIFAVAAHAELSIHVTSHHVFWIWHHSKIVMTYDDPTECTGCQPNQISEISPNTEGCFTTDRRDTGFCTTFGAGSVRGRLFGKTNRPSGLKDELTSPSIEVVPPTGQSLEEVLQSLLNSLDAHTDDWNCNEDTRMNYDLFPRTGKSYNSNSFISGITRFVGLPESDLKPDRRVPGYSSPVPDQRFSFSGCEGG